MERFSRESGFNSGQVNRWVNGQQPRMDHAIRVIEILGGDIERARPDWFPEQVSERAIVYGDIPAGETDMVEELQEEIDARELNFGHSGVAHLVDRKHPIVFLRVGGESMEPDFPRHALIACRPPRPDSIERIPKGWPAVLEDPADGSMTFKLYYPKQGKGGREYAIGQAINRRFEPVVFAKGCLVRFLVLGQVMPLESGSSIQVIPKPRIFRDPEQLDAVAEDVEEYEHETDR